VTIKTKILGVAYGGGHANIVFPVLKELNLRGNLTSFLALTSAGPQAERQGIEYKSYIDYRHLVDSKKAARLGSPLADKMHNPNIGITLDESVYYLGINLMENIESLGEELAREAFQLAGRSSFLPVEFFKKIMVEERFTHVLSTNSPRSEKASLIAAQQLGLKSFRIDDLYGVPVLYDTLMQKMGAEIYHRTTGRYKLTPTQSCFLCDFARDHFISRQDKWDIVGVDHSNSTVTGQPAFDAIDKIMQDRPTECLFPDRQHLPTVTWAHENGHRDETEVVAILEKCFRSWGSEFNFVIKLRPNIDPGQIENILNRFDSSQGNLRLVHTEMDPNVLIWNSTIVLGQVSTMLTQAAYMGRPVVILDPIQLRANEPLAQTGVARLARNADELRAAINALGQTDSQMFQDFEAGCQSMHFQNHGTNNVCNLIAQSL